MKRKLGEDGNAVLAAVREECVLGGFKLQTGLTENFPADECEQWGERDGGEEEETARHG